MILSRPLIFTQQAEGDGSGFMKKPSIAICPGLKKVLRNTERNQNSRALCTVYTTLR